MVICCSLPVGRLFGFFEQFLFNGALLSLKNFFSEEKKISEKIIFF